MGEAWGGPQVMSPQQLVCSFLMASTKHGSKIHGPLMSSESWFLPAFPTYQLCQSPRYSECDEEEVGRLGSIPENQGSW